MNPKRETMTETLEVTNQELVHLIATDPRQMADAQSHLRKFLAAKVHELSLELGDIKHAYDIAVANQWSAGTLKRQLQRGQNRRIFYEKALAAVEAGYTIIPNFPLSVFAIRTKRDSPSQYVYESTWSRATAVNRVPAVKTQALSIGEGRYVSERPTIATDTQKFKEGDKEKITHQAWPVEFREVVFPINIARPQMMQATAEAMLLKVFDEIGICPPVRQPDPLIIGRISMKRISRWQEPMALSFLIAWHLDLRTL